MPTTRNSLAATGPVGSGLGQARALILFGMALVGGCFNSDGLSSAILGPGILQFSAATYAVSEDGTNITLSVTRVGGVIGAVGVNYATSNGSAVQPADYLSASGTLSWADGDAAAKTFTISVSPDTDVEGDETVNLTLSLPTGGAALGSPDTAVLTLQDADTPASGALQFSQATYAVNESAGTLTVTVTRTGGSAGAISVDVVDVGTGSATGGGVDYTFTSPTTLNWADGDGASKTATLTIVADGTIDAAAVETVNLALQNPAAVPPNVVVPVVGTQGTAVVQITDSDRTGTVQFNPAAVSVNESAGTATITVTRSNGTQGAASVDVVDAGTGSATSGTDYSFTSPTTLSWADGEAGAKTATVTVTNDTAVEANETVAFNLQNVSGATLGAPTSATLTILNDDSPGTITFTSATYSVAENVAGGTATITVTRTGGSSGAASVEVTDNGNGSAGGGDYSFVDPTLVTWADGETGPKSVTVTITDDSNVDPDETVEFDLQNEVGATLGAITTATLTIVDDDSPAAGNVTFSASNVYSVAESPTRVVAFTVSRVGGSAGTITVDFTLTDGTANSAGAPATWDYLTPGSGTLTWGNGDTTDKTINVLIVDNDGVPDAAQETFTMTLSNPSAGVSIVGTNPVTVTINDD